MAGKIKKFDLAKMSTATTGSGTITLGSAITGWLTFAQAGVANGDWVRYAIEDGNNREVGYGQYTASGTTLTRNPTTSTNSNAAINLSGAAKVFIIGGADDYPDLRMRPHRAWRLAIPVVQTAAEYADTNELKFYDENNTLLDPYTNGVILDFGSFSGFAASRAFNQSSFAEWASDAPTGYSSAGGGTAYKMACIGFYMNSGAVALSKFSYKCTSGYTGRAPKNFALQYCDSTGMGLWKTYQEWIAEAAWTNSEVRTYTLNALGIE